MKFNQTERTFENFVSFVKNTTGKNTVYIVFVLSI